MNFYGQCEKKKNPLEILKKNPCVVTWSWSVSVSVPGRNRDVSVQRFDTGEPRTGMYTRRGLPQGWRFTTAALHQRAYGYYVSERRRAESCTTKAFRHLKAESVVMFAGRDNDGVMNQPWEQLNLQTVKQLRAKHYCCSHCEIKCVCVCVIKHRLHLTGEVSAELLMSVKTSEKMGDFRESDCTGKSSPV